MSRERAPRPAAHANYKDVRRDIKTGDVLFFGGRVFLSRFIEWGSKSPYSHAGIAAWWHDRLMVFQAEVNGVEVVPASIAVDRYNGRVDWWSLKPEDRAKVNDGELISAALDEIGKPYDFARLGELVALMCLGRYRGTPDPAHPPKAMFCSQYVSYCFRAAGLDLVPGTEDANTSPGDLARSGLLVPRAILHSPKDAANALHQ